MTTVAAILGSATPPGRLRRSVADALERCPAATELFDLAEHPLPFAGSVPADAPILDGVATADAILIATPVYRGTYTGVLKNLLDLLPVESLCGKAVAIAAMGASDHHYLGPDWHLRDTLGWFGAVALPTSVYLNSRDFEDGVPSSRAAGELDELLTGLVSLADALPRALGPKPLAVRVR